MAGQKVTQTLEQLATRVGEYDTSALELMESAPDAMIVVDGEGTLLLVNSQVEKVFGYAREELLGEKIEVLVPEEIRDAHVGYRNGYFANPRPELTRTGLDLRGQRKDGSLFPAEVSLSPINTEKGRLVVSVIRDVSRRKQAEQHLARSNRDLHTLTLVNEAVMAALTEEQLPHDVCRLVVEANEKCMAWVGYEQRNGKGITPQARYGYEKGFIDDLPLTWVEGELQHCPTGRVIRSGNTVLLSDIAQSAISEGWREAALDRGYRSMLVVPLTQYGDAFGALTIYSTEVDGFDEDNIHTLERLGDNISHAILAVRSEIARKAAEEELSVSEERSRLLLKSAGDGIFGTDAHGHITFANLAVETLLGFTQKELIGYKAHPLFHHSHANGSNYPVKECPMFAAFTYGTTHHVDDEVLWRKDGSSFEVEYSSVPIRKDEELVGAVITFRDITERREAEAKMRAVWDNSGDGYLWLDQAFRFVGCNPAAVELFGCAGDAELLGKTPLDFSPEAQPDGTSSIDKAAEYAKLVTAGEGRRRGCHQGQV